MILFTPDNLEFAGFCTTATERAGKPIPAAPRARGIIELQLATDCHTFDGQLFLLCPYV
jgi:hypothetical protein